MFLLCQYEGFLFLPRKRLFTQHYLVLHWNCAITSPSFLRELFRCNVSLSMTMYSATSGDNVSRYFSRPIFFSRVLGVKFRENLFRKLN